MNELMRQKLVIYGQWAYRGAWALEITAAFIGLAMGFAFFIRTFSESDSVSAVVPVAALVMVSLAELTKIPVATLLYASSWTWKPLLFIFLASLATITFLTVFQGLTKSAYSREYLYNQLTQQIDVIEKEIQSITEALDAANKSDQIDQAQKNIEKIESLVEGERTSLQKQIEGVDKELEGQVVLTQPAAQARNRLREAEERRVSRLAERDKEIKEAMEAFERQRESYVNRISSPTASPEQKEQWGKELHALSSPRPAIMANHQNAITEIDDEIKALREAFEDLRGKGVAVAGPQRKQLEDRRSALLRLLSNLDDKWLPQREDARKSLSGGQAAEANKAQTITVNKARLEQITKDRSAIEAKRIPVANEDQVRQIAGMIFGKEPWAVSRSEAQKIKLTWFGSLALLAAIAGPVMAMVALALQRIGSDPDKTRSQSKLGNLLRNILLRWRWTRVKTVKVQTIIEKEIEIEKIVEKPVEVQVEKVIKEILYVPILTDDPEAIKRALYDAVPKDLADTVQVSMKGNTIAGSA